MEIEIHDVSKNNLQEILQLHVATSQENFVESTRQCLKEARECTQYKPVGLYADGEPVGFSMYGYFPREQRLWLDRFLIDEHFQGKGMGTIFLQAMLDTLKKEYPAQAIYLSVYENNLPAIYLYEKFGFKFIDERDINGEKIMKLETAMR
ncbi:GNAT family N-acetyltransferase [Virgibacillus halodenitrificans]|uniref:GNAT family N-acetyltransferase n=1 Tax=Virgibacillus halodenitrificans TaxID=1482 RepID=UPI0007612688